LEGGVEYKPLCNFTAQITDVGFAVLGCSNHLVDTPAFKGIIVRHLLIKYFTFKARGDFNSNSGTISKSSQETPKADCRPFRLWAAGRQQTVMQNSNKPLSTRGSRGQFFKGIIKLIQLLRNGIQVEFVPVQFCGMQEDVSVPQGWGCSGGALRGMIKLLVGGEQGLALPKQQEDRLGLLWHIRENAHSLIMTPLAYGDEVIGR
jgi:hypothetical protein